jgi:hypothetical protein
VLRKAIEKIGKPLTKLGKLLRKMSILGSRFDTRFATTCVHGFTLLISSTHNLKYIIIVIHLLPKEIAGGIYSGVIIKDVRSQGGACWYLSSNIYFKLSTSKSDEP